MREMKHWSAQSTLQNTLLDVDWDMFWACNNDINEFADVAISFVRLPAGQIIPKGRVSVPESKTMGGQIDPRHSECHDRCLQRRTHHWQYH